VAPGGASVLVSCPTITLHSGADPY